MGNNLACFVVPHIGLGFKNAITVVSIVRIKCSLEIDGVLIRICKCLNFKFKSIKSVDDLKVRSFL